jgi:hypothetical protein
MKLGESVIAFTAGTGVTGQPEGRIRVGEWPDKTGWSNSFEVKMGACDPSIAELDTEQARSWLLQAFHWLVLKRNFHPVSVNSEFGGIDEYATALFDPFMPPGL